MATNCSVPSLVRCAAPNDGLIVPRWTSFNRAARSDRRAGCSPPHSCGLRSPDFVAAGGLISYGPDCRPVSPRGWLRRSHPQRREARRPAGAGADQVRVGDQSQDREGARPRRAADAARPRRRGDRMISAASSSRCSAARRRRGRSRRARSNPSGCGASACSCAAAAGRSGQCRPHRGVRAGAAAIGLDRRPQPADRRSLGRQCRHSIRKYAAELVALAPDVILAVGSVTMAPVLQATRTVPIVFVQVVDPVGAGFVESLARPGGNATGFILFEYGLSGKWLELLKQIAPGVTRAAVLARSHDHRRDRPVRRRPVRGAVVRGGGQPGRRARRRRDRACRRGLCARGNGGLIVTRAR